MKKFLLRSISNLFHPLLAMTWATVILITLTPFALFNLELRLILLGWVIAFTVLLPSFFIWVCSKLGIVKGGVALRDRRDRGIPLFLNALCNLFLCLSVHGMGLLGWMESLYCGGFVLTVIMFVVSLFWKISAHAAGGGAITTAAFTLHLVYPTLVPFALPIVSLLLSGFLCSIRLWLGRHTMAQVGAGTLVGIVCIVGAVTLWG